MYWKIFSCAFYFVKKNCLRITLESELLWSHSVETKILLLLQNYWIILKMKKVCLVYIIAILGVSHLVNDYFCAIFWPFLMNYWIIFVQLFWPFLMNYWISLKMKKVRLASSIAVLLGVSIIISSEWLFFCANFFGHFWWFFKVGSNAISV